MDEFAADAERAALERRGRPEQSADQRREDVGDERIDQRADGRADHHRDREIRRLAAKQELREPARHGPAALGHSTAQAERVQAH